MLGGWLIKQVGFNATFLLTAALQACSIACLLPLLRLVSAEHRPSQRAVSRQAGGSAASEQLLPSTHYAQQQGLRGGGGVTTPQHAD